MATPHLNNLAYLQDLLKTQITQAKLDLTINGKPVEPWLEQALTPLFINALTSWIPYIIEQEKKLAVPEVEGEIKSTKDDLAALEKLLKDLEK